MKRISLVLFFSFIATWVLAQGGGVLAFKSLEHQFGDAREDGGQLRHTFEFTNKGNAPVIIYGVSTSCGCTVSEWTKEPVLPGKKGMVTAVFDPMGRPYSFSKTLTVRTNTEPSNITLSIRGYVIPRNATDQDLYAQRLGDVGFRSFYQMMGEVASHTVQKVVIPVHNFSLEPKTVEFKDLPKYISGKSKIKLKPRETGAISLEIKMNKVKEWGAISVEMKIESGAAVGAFYLHFTRVEDFSQLTHKQRENAPHLEIPSPLVAFGNCSSGDTVVREFDLKNVGKSPLEVRRVITNCSCITYKLDKAPIPAGGSAKLTLEFNTEGYRGEQSRTVYIIVNDPVEATRSVELTGTVQ
jgi:hypothetical protein